MKELMPSKIRVLFVGDKPPKNGLNTSFLSDRDSKILSQWLKVLGVDTREFVGINRTDEYFVEAAQSFAEKNIPIIALGESAHQYLLKAKLLHYCLAHPSSENHTRSKAQINTLLKRARMYIDNVEEFYQK